MCTSPLRAYRVSGTHADEAGTVTTAKDTRPHQLYPVPVRFCSSRRVSHKGPPSIKTPPLWAASENRTVRSLLSGGQPVLVEFQEVVGRRQQPPLGQHG